MSDTANRAAEPVRALVGSIQKFSIEDGPGIRTTVFIKGCPLNCRWCHNPELINPDQQLITSPANCIGCGFCIKTCPQNALSMDPERGVVINRDTCDLCLTCAENCFARGIRAVAKPMSADEILDVVEQDADFYSTTEGGMTVSGGEVLMHAAFTEALVDKAAARGIDACIDTCGFGSPEALLALAAKDSVTHVLFDMKCIDDETHRWFTGVSNELIIENLRMLANDPRTASKLIMRMPLAKDVNDTREIITRTGELYRELGITNVTLLPYHNLGVSKGRNIGIEQEQFDPPTEERLQQIVNEYITNFGLKTDILGRI